MHYKAPPGNTSDFERRIAFYARDKNIDIKRIKSDIGNMVVAQMLPPNCIVKGGGSMCIRYPIAQTRFSSDLDLVYGTSLEDFTTKFKEQLAIGWNDFTGEIQNRGSAPLNTTMPKGFEMTPIDIKLYYKSKHFRTIEIDATPEMTDEVSNADIVDFTDVFTIFEEFRLMKPKAVSLLSIEQQIAQKFEALTGQNINARHLVDISIIINSEESINKEKLITSLHDTFNLAKREYSTDLSKVIQKIKNTYPEIAENTNAERDIKIATEQIINLLS
jgi:predicted nucleotidyltransferase component of viral defense system